jgi:hypothetical protein
MADCDWPCLASDGADQQSPKIVAATKHLGSLDSDGARRGPFVGLQLQSWPTATQDHCRYEAPPMHLLMDLSTKDLPADVTRNLLMDLSTKDPVVLVDLPTNPVTSTRGAGHSGRRAHNPRRRGADNTNELICDVVAWTSGSTIPSTCAAGSTIPSWGVPGIAQRF